MGARQAPRAARAVRRALLESAGRSRGPGRGAGVRQLLSSNLFTSDLEACVNKNRRLEKAMDAAEETITEGDVLIRKVNMINELKDGEGSPRSVNVSSIMRGGPSPSLTRQN